MITQALRTAPLVEVPALQAIAELAAERAAEPAPENSTAP